VHSGLEHVSHEEIQSKVEKLISFVHKTTGQFEERDVVYIIVELYKDIERQLGSNRTEIIEKFTHLAFFRDWIVHTNMNSQKWVDEQEILNDPDKLCLLIQGYIENEEAYNSFLSMSESFANCLNGITADQEIFSKTK
jgi:hypothetical protein